MSNEEVKKINGQAFILEIIKKMVNISGTHYEESVLGKMNIHSKQRAEKSESLIESRKNERDSCVEP